MTYSERVSNLLATDPEVLRSAMLNAEYNTFISGCADKDDSKRVPYIGWYWRDVDWSDLEHIPVASCGEFIGFIMNNKWGYEQRYLTKDEAVKVVEIIDKAMENKGGLLSNIIAERDKHLKELWDYMQTLVI
jgi:hypothetical protein